MRITKTFVVMALAGAAAVGVSAQAVSGRAGRMQGPGPGGPGGVGGPGRPGFERALQLTEAQQESIKSLREKEREAIKPIADQIQPLRGKLREALEAGSDATTVGQLVLDTHGLEKQIQEVRKSYHDQFVALLTAEQKEKLETLESLMGPGRGQGPGGRRFGGRGFGRPPFDGPPPANQ